MSDAAPSCASLLEKCIASKHLNLGKHLHSLLIKTALNLNIFLANRLIHMYSICNSLQSAQKVFDDLSTKNTHSYNTILSAYARYGLFDNAHNLFDKISRPNVVTYNSMISSLTRYGRHKEAVGIFLQMQKHFSSPLIDRFTFVSITGACAGMTALKLLRQIHAMVLVVGFELNLIMYNALIDSYGKCGDVSSSHGIFYQMPSQDVVSWTSLVVAYARAHRLEEACQVFDRMPERNAISWTALISGFAQNGHGNKALYFFSMMQEEGIRPSEFTYVSVLSACGSLTLIECGRQVHGRLRRSYIGSDSFNVFLFNALIDMYSKCGDMTSSSTLFEEMPERDIVSWNSLVTGFAQNGYGKKSLSIFERMTEEGIAPNHVTFLGMLSMCSHAGLVSEGCQLLHSMEKDYKVHPTSEHFAVIIDALGRKNRFEEAVDLIEKEDFGSQKIGMWGALLGSCRIHGKLDLATRAAEVLFAMEPMNGARYVMLSNIYAAAGRWEDVQRVRGLMKDRGISKEPAYSWIEVRNAKLGFVTEDRSHEQTKEIYELLDTLTDQIRGAGYLSVLREEDELF